MAAALQARVPPPELLAELLATQRTFTCGQSPSDPLCVHECEREHAGIYRPLKQGKQATVASQRVALGAFVHTRQTPSPHEDARDTYTMLTPSVLYLQCALRPKRRASALQRSLPRTGCANGAEDDSSPIANRAALRGNSEGL